MTITYAPLFLKASASPEEEKQSRFLKALKASKLYKWLESRRGSESKMHDGDSTTARGHIRNTRGNKRKSNAGVLAMLWDNAEISMLFLNEAMGLEKIKDVLHFITTPLMQVRGHTQTPENISHSDFLQEDFSTSVEYVSEELSNAFEEQVNAQKCTAECTAAQIANIEFIGPLRPEIHDLTSAFLDNKISQKTFEGEATSTLLKYQGIVYSKADETYAISPKKLEDIRRNFEASTGKSSLGSSPILVFKNATLVISAEPKNFEAVQTLQPALIPA